MALLWLDLETTGTKAGRDALLEVACIVTDDEFNEIARIQRVVYYQHAATIVEELDRQRKLYDEVNYDHAESNLRGRTGAANVCAYVLAMHDKNGLWRDCVNGLALDTVDRDLAAFVKAHGITWTSDADPVKGHAGLPKPVLPQLAGSTISFDRAFINAYLPRLADEKVLHYRNLDVSTLNEMAKRCFVGLYERRPNAGLGKENAAHRGMADIEESINVFHHYRRAFARGLATFVSTGGDLEGLVAP